MFPLNDDIPTRRPTPVHYGIMAGCILVFLWQVFGAAQPDRFIYEFGIMPAALFGNLIGGLDTGPAPWVTVFTSQFLHGGWMHLIGNMMFLFIFGNNVEEAFGSAWFIVFYLGCGVAAALTQSIVDTQSTIPMIGASGAISGVLGAYIVLFPKARVLTLVFIGIVTVLRIPAAWFLGGWFAFQAFSAVVSISSVGQTGGTAFLAHVGGFVVGVGVALVLRPNIIRPRGPWG